MKQHQYRVQVEHLADAKGNPSSYDEPLVFEVGNHDDIFAVVEKVKTLSGLPEDKAVPFALGLKLFGETILENKDHPLFEEMGPHFMQFMKKLKGKG